LRPEQLLASPVHGRFPTLDCLLPSFTTFQTVLPDSSHPSAGARVTDTAPVFAPIVSSFFVFPLTFTTYDTASSLHLMTSPPWRGLFLIFFPKESLFNLRQLYVLGPPVSLKLPCVRSREGAWFLCSVHWPALLDLAPPSLMPCVHVCRSRFLKKIFFPLGFPPLQMWP